MVEDILRTEIHDMSNKIYELQEKTEHLTNGQRYAAINEIEKSMQPLRNDLRHLENQLYMQKTNDINIQKSIDEIISQLDALENIKSDLTARINTENEHTRQELNNKIIKFMGDELLPIKHNIEDNQKEIKEVKEDIHALRLEITEHYKNQEIKEVARFDNFKMIITAVIAVLAALSTLSLWLEPSIRTLMQIFL